MARSRGESRAARRRRSIAPEQADARIDGIRRHWVPSRTAHENLDRPVDPDLRVTGDFPYRKLSLVVRGEEVSSLGVVDFQQQIGSQAVRMGGLAGVGTHRDHRFQGYSGRVMESALRWMRAEGYDTSMLYGIPCFYPRFGYTQAFPHVELSVAVRDAEKLAPRGYRLVGFARRHLRAVLRMYHDNNAGRTGPTRREAKHWRPFRKGVHFGSKAVCKVALDARGRPVGYFVYDSEHLTATIIEAGFATTKVFPDILRAAARLAVKYRLERIKLLLPEDDAFVAFCLPLGMRKEVSYRRDGGAQIRLVNIPSALKKVSADLGPRTSGRGRLTLRTNLDDVGLSWSGGRLRVGPPRADGPQARLPQWALAQLLYGYRSAAALAAAGTLRAPRGAVATLEAMFPTRPHFHYAVDHF